MNSFPSRLRLLGGSASLLALAACVGGCHRDAAVPPAPPPIATLPAAPTVPPSPAPAVKPKKPTAQTAPAPRPQASRPPAPERTLPAPKPPAKVVRLAPAPKMPAPAAVKPPPRPPEPAKVAIHPRPKSVTATPKLTETLTTDPSTFFQAVRERVPGQTLNVVYVKGDKGNPVRLLELPETPGAAAPPAAAIAHDLQAAFVQDPLLADHLTVTAQEGGTALALPNAPRPLFVISQDAADEQGVTTVQAAQGVIETLRTTLGPQQRDLVVVPRATTPEAQMRPEQKQGRAQELRRLGDDAYLGKDWRRAELCYRQATKLTPDYPVPFLRLAGFYHEKKQDDRARATLKQALESGGLTPRQKQTILARQAALKS